MRVGVAVDSSTDLDRAALDAFGLESAPIVVVLDGEEIEVGPQLDAASFVRRVAATPLERLSTSGVNVEAWSGAIERLRGRGAEAVLLLALASGLSVTCRSARAAAELADPFPVRVVDSGTASCGLAALALGAARLAASGADLEALERWAAAAASRARTILASRDTSILRHIGRVGEEAGAGDARYVLLEIGQRIRPAGTARDEAEAAERMLALLREVWAAEPPAGAGGWQVVVGHGGNREAAALLERRIGEERGLSGRCDLFRVDDGPIFAILSRAPGGFGLGIAPRPALG
ncbi:MAG: DegV family protein [Bacillota bacterium]|nr:DegV family protein [Bacillota bacterium]